MADQGGGGVVDGEDHIGERFHREGFLRGDGPHHGSEQTELVGDAGTESEGDAAKVRSVCSGVVTWVLLVRGVSGVSADERGSLHGMRGIRSQVIELSTYYVWGRAVGINEAL
ncbi:hypothetical protein R3Q06_33080 [Rhodococcus erythropolis]|uniref:hypothetical protein n=1 Tax=Rhodococcus erythropolis TaxID=1833 RepID=UPI002949EDBA|nr:hypothetical protein [Rhodococcus erythropolis]MDV6278284.1 hypothetical protein [Rhodococcus erythropolis]